MKKRRGISLRWFLNVALLVCPGWALAEGVGPMALPMTVIGFASPPVVVEALGMGNAVVADGTLFNASAFNPALLANDIDFTEVHLGSNFSNDILGIVNYVTNNGEINGLSNSLNNVNQSFQDFTNALQGFGSNNFSNQNVNTFNQGVTGIQSAINNLNTALNNVTDKTIQVGAGLDIAVKVDDHIGFQVYNTSQAAVQIGRGSLVQAFKALSLPTLPTSPSFAQAAQAAVSLYNSSAAILNGFITPGETATLQQAAVTLQNKINGGTVTNVDIQNFANVASGAFNSLSTNAAENTLFNNIAPINVLTYSDTVLMGTYCLRPLEDDKSLSVGVNLKAVNRYIASINSNYLSTQNLNNSSDIGNDLKNDIEQSTWRWGVDLGVLYEFLDPRIKVGASATDILHNTASLNTAPGDPLYGITTDSAPTDFRVGLSYKPIRELTLNGDIDDLFNNTTYYQGLSFPYHIDFGFNYDLIGLIQLRGGVTNGNLCGGFGFLQFVQYAYEVNSLTQSYNHYLQFDVAF